MNNNVKNQAIHLDLKGVPPTFERLIQLLDVFQAGGYNAVLVEWEDMFPWTVDKRFRCKTAYTAEQVKKFLKSAKEKDFEVIPLVQCLGHMETVLRIEDYAHLREVPEKCDCLNPLAKGAGEFIGAMYDDVLAICDDIKYFHLGGDEAYSFGTHPDTKVYIEKHSREKLYLKHIDPLLNKLIAQNIRPILWHDMMIDWNDSALKEISRKADLCVWGYCETPYETDLHYNIKYIERFHKLGVPLWGATAFKGADGQSADIPSPETRKHNASSWGQIADKFKFEGLIATGWSRYSTTRVQCETIDASLDSIIYTGWLLANGKLPCDLDTQIQKTLKEIGQLEIFERCRVVARKLCDKRKWFWSLIQEYYEQKRLQELQPTRKATEINSFILNFMKKTLAETELLADIFRESFEGLIEDIWIEEYIDTRLSAMSTALDEMIRKLES